MPNPLTDIYTNHPLSVTRYPLPVTRYVSPVTIKIRDYTSDPCSPCGISIIYFVLLDIINLFHRVNPRSIKTQH